MTSSRFTRGIRRLARIGATLVFVSLIVFTPLSPVAAPVAHGQIPTTVTGDIPSEIQRVLDSIGWIVAKTAVNSLTQSVVNWINSGFEGSPAFVTDLNRNLGNLADAVADDFIRGLDQVVVDNTGFSIRAPFQDQIASALREEFYRTTSSYGFDIRNPYRDCYGGRGFNLNGFFCESQNPANNAYGRYDLARNELFKTLDRTAQNRIAELGWGKGFLSFRGPCGQYGNTPTTSTAAAAVSLSQAEASSNCPIRTPGAVIENALGISVTSPFRQLELADNINEIVAALMTQMVNQVLGSGGLTGVSQPSAGGGPSYLDRATSSSEGFAQNIADTRSKIISYQAGWQRIRDAAQSARQACSNSGDKAAQADAVLNTANAQLSDAIAKLATLASIDAERVRLTNSGTTDSQAITTLVTRFTDLLSATKTLAQGEAESVSTGNAEPGSLYSQMTRLTASCR